MKLHDLYSDEEEVDDKNHVAQEQNLARNPSFDRYAQDKTKKKVGFTATGTPSQSPECDLQPRDDIPRRDIMTRQKGRKFLIGQNNSE